jgi:tRNA(Ile)-lysidine synthase
VINDKLFKKDEKYLLACSGGVDSIALFYALLDNNIDFSVATINYNFRPESILEVENVEKICQENNIDFFLFENNKNISNNMEAEARNIRYDFFDSIIKKNRLNGLITGHNLNDKLEWFLMQLTKGCGFNELIGMELISERKGYKVIKPFLDIDRTEIEKYISDNNIISFEDKSNFDISYHPIDNPRGVRRNYFRHHFANKLVKEFKKGIKKSFSIFEQEKKYLENQYKIKELKNRCYLIEVDTTDSIMVVKALDILFKKHLKYLISGDLRKEIILQLNKGIVIQNYAIGISNGQILVTPYLSKYEIKMDDNIKNFFRRNKTPIKNRLYLFSLLDLDFLNEIIF